MLEGATIARAEIVDPRLTRPVEPGLVAEMRSWARPIAAVDRRGKYLLWRLESGRTLVVHLRMTGSFRHARQATFPPTPTGARRSRSTPAPTSAYRDVRRFGTWELLDDGHLRPYLDTRLGPEPLAPSFTRARLARIVAGRRAPIKAFLLDQRRIAGIGNIYADEALWRARIHPLRPAGELDADGDRAPASRGARGPPARCRAQGSTLRDYVTPDGEGGGMQHEFHVYGRLGEPCDRCGQTDRAHRRRRPRHVVLPALPGDVSSVSLGASPEACRAGLPEVDGPGSTLWTNVHEVGALSFPIRLRCPDRL